jgi:hypothetical protein
MAAPPPRLEKLVLALIPPLARETVAGDLCETCESPRQYAVEALRTVPLVVVSQIRRNLNLPAQALKMALAWIFLGSGALWLLPVLLLADAYQPAARPDAHHAIRQTMILGLAAMIFVQALSMNVDVMLRMGLSRPNWLALYLFGMVVPALLCLLRTGVILHNDRHPLPGTMTPQTLAEIHGAFLQRARWHNIVEGVALVVAATLALLWLKAPAAAALTALYLLTAIYLLLRGAPQTLPSGDLRSGLAHYARDLARQRRLRHFLWWLWSAPLLMALAAQLQAAPLVAAVSRGGLILLCFLLAVVNREHGGRVQEEIGALTRG